MKHKKHNLLNAAYLYYYASDVIFSAGGSADDAATHQVKAKSKLEERLNALVNDVLMVAQKVTCLISLCIDSLIYYRLGLTS